MDEFELVWILVQKQCNTSLFFYHSIKRSQRSLHFIYATIFDSKDNPALFASLLYSCNYKPPYYSCNFEIKQLNLKSVPPPSTFLRSLSIFYPWQMHSKFTRGKCSYQRNCVTEIHMRLTQGFFLFSKFCLHILYLF